MPLSELCHNKRTPGQGLLAFRSALCNVQTATSIQRLFCPHANEPRHTNSSLRCAARRCERKMHYTNMSQTLVLCITDINPLIVAPLVIACVVYQHPLLLTILKRTQRHSIAVLQVACILHFSREDTVGRRNRAGTRSKAVSLSPCKRPKRDYGCTTRCGVKVEGSHIAASKFSNACTVEC